MPNAHSPSKTASLHLERSLWESGFTHVAGLDEAGRGAWAGPVAAAIVILPPHFDPALLVGVTDSKQLSARQRAALFDRICGAALAWGIGSADAREIDTRGIVPATLLAMRRALDQAAAQFPHVAPDYLLLDAVRWPELWPPHESIIRGDQQSLSVAAASILAKVWRDEYMAALDAAHPPYGFGIHKGYGTARHAAALKTHGVTPAHRRSFAPVRAALEHLHAAY